MEHSNNCLIVVGQEIAKLKRNYMKMELQKSTQVSYDHRNIHYLPATGTMKDLKDQLAQARQKRWLPPRQASPSRDEAPKSEG